ncbi:MAG TPA: hypothetical protein ENJ19_07715, partial [Gammaproteobacteria bacterium]|nr:hypothetical protein [Gammaproteobacteria bacterium]
MLVWCLLGMFGLAACSGGGDGTPDSGSPQGSTGSTATTASGAAVKGVIKQGRVTVEELASDGSVLRTVGTATTDDAGEYTVTLDTAYAGGPLLFTLSADETTAMVCDVAPACGTRNDDIADANGNSTVDVGEDMRVPGLAMTAILPKADSGATVSAQITPFTHMAAQRALREAVVDAAAAETANSEVANLLGGVDILRVRPVNLTDPAAMDEAREDQRVYALLSAAVGALAVQEGRPLAEAVNTVAGSFSQGTLVASEGVPDPANYSLQELQDALETQRSLMNVEDRSGMLAGLLNRFQDAITTAGVDGIIDPEPSPNAGDSDIAKAKALVQEIRNWAKQIAALENPADAFEADVEQAGKLTEAFNQGSGDSVTGALRMVKAFLDSGAGNGEYEFGAGKFIDTDGLGLTGNGTVTVTGTGSGTLTLALAGSITPPSKIEFSEGRPVQLNFPPQNLDLTFTVNEARDSQLEGSVAGTVTDSAGSAKLTVTNGTFNISGSSLSLDNLEATGSTL